MKFLGGFLKFIGILLMLIGTAACTLCCFFAVEDNDPSLYIVGGAVFLSFLFVALGVLGTGTALGQVVKLKKRVAALEQRLWNMSAAPAAAPAPAAEELPVAAPAEPVPAAAPEVAPAAEPAAAPTNKKWLPIALGAVCLVLVVVLIVSLSGGKDQDNGVMEAPQQQPVTMAPMEVIEPETEAPAEIEVAELNMHDSLSTGFVDMYFNEVVVAKDIQKSVTIDRVTRTTGPEPLSGQHYICLSGTIINTSNAPLPVYDFFTGRFEVDGYTYEVSANDCDILSPDGQTESEIDPLMEYEFRIYTAIPDALAEVASAGDACSFTFGFYDGFDNQELAYNKAFSDNPIAECPYQYFISFR